MQLTLSEIINKLHSLSPRLLNNQTQTAEYLKELFNKANIDYSVETFDTQIPVVTKAELLVDGQRIPCRSTSLISGTIDKNCDIVDSSTDYSETGTPNLNYNSKSDSISRAAHYLVPSLAFSRTQLELVKNAAIIQGTVEIEHVPHTSQNIIVGNTSNPINLVFTHFDSLEGGAMDNASGTAVTLKTILDQPQLLQTNLFIFSSDEELSFDNPYYWGKGYRDFESKHPLLFESCQKIYIVDGLGLTPAHVHQHLIEEYFPIVNINKYTPKIFAISCDELSQWTVYHSIDDTPDKLNPEFLEQSLTLVKQTLSPRPNINIDTSLFPSDKIITIIASDYFSAYKQLALKTKDDILQVLHYYQQFPTYFAMLKKSKRHLHQLLALRQTHAHLFTTSNQVNHLEKYLEIFVGFCQGAGITLEEGALLQLELESGCQSLAVKNHKTGQISGFHTEEDCTAYDRFNNAAHGKYWVNLTVGTNQVNYLYYAGVCAYGSTSSVVQTTDSCMLNISDVLGPNIEGTVWANLVNFMIMDCKNLDQVKELVTQLNRLPSPKFFGGYTITLHECQPHPDMLQIEFGGDLITFIDPQNMDNISYHSGINYPHDNYIKSIDIASEIEDDNKYDLEGLRKIYEDRFSRLTQAASEISTNTNPDILTSIIQSMANPEGVWRQEWFTGFANCYVANYLVYNISPTGSLEFRLIYGNPKTYNSNNENISAATNNS